MFRNIAAAGVGVWVGGMVSGAVVGLLPKQADGSVNPMVQTIAQSFVVGAAAYYAMKLLGHKKS